MRATTVLIAAAAGFANAKTIAIEAGNGGLVFKPDDIKADVGDILEFQFLPANHSVAQASFASPCQPLAQNGFYSGYFPVSSGKAAQVFRVRVNDTNPIYFYCTQPNRKHCSSGMVGIVNAAAGTSVAAYKQAAASYSGDPGTPASVYGGEVATASSGSGGSSTTSTTGSATSTPSGSRAASITSTSSMSNPASVTTTTTGSSSAPSAATTTSSSRAAAGTMAAAMHGVVGVLALAALGLA